MARYQIMAGMLVLLLFSNGPAKAADTSGADDAINDAIRLLETRSAKLRDKSEIAKLRTAITNLKSLLLSPTTENVEFRDLIDNPEDYKGKTIRIRLTLESALPSSGKSLRELAGSDVPFRAFGRKGERLNILVFVPSELVVPRAQYSDELTVTFRCSEGSLTKGNIATSISRP